MNHEDTNHKDIDSLVQRLHRGDESAYDEVFRDYYARLVGLAQRKLIAVPPQVADGEGAVISAFRSFFSGIENGQFEQVVDRHELWKLLVTITARKSIKQLRGHFKKSGEANQVDRTVDLGIVRSHEPTAEDVAELVDECNQLLASLPNDKLRQIAELRLQGFESREIAQSLGIHQRSVQRKLSLIAAEWTAMQK